MLVTLDLTARQAARILEAALQTRATLEIEPRPEVHSALLWGTLAGRESDRLLVDLHHADQGTPLRALLGAMCDVRTILRGQLCLFSSFILDLVDGAVPQRIMLAVPDSIQIANRRRFARKHPAEPVPVHLAVPGTAPPLTALLANIGARGLACRLVGRDADDLLFIGDEVEVQFALPWAPDLYTLRACVCSKTAGDDHGHLVVGFEFAGPDDHPSLQRLRTALNDETARLIQSDGDL